MEFIGYAGIQTTTRQSITFHESVNTVTFSSTHTYIGDQTDQSIEAGQSMKKVDIFVLLFRLECKIVHFVYLSFFHLFL